MLECVGRDGYEATTVPQVVATARVSRNSFYEFFADLGRRARAEQPELGPLSELIPRVLVLTITELVADEVRAGRTAKLTSLSEEIALLAIRLLADDATAERARAEGLAAEDGEAA